MIFRVMRRFKILDTVGSIFQTLLTENWEEEEDAEEESSNYKAICFSCKLKKEAYVLIKWKSLKLNKYKTIYTQNERFSGYALKVNLIPGGVFFKLGFTPCKAEHALGGMKLQEKEAQKD